MAKAMKKEKKITIDKFGIVQSEIKKSYWFNFGKGDFDCPGFEQSLDFYLEKDQLPKPCDECYKALVFWDGSSKKNMTNFFNMLNSFESNYDGKLNNGVVVFYFREKDKMLTFIDYLQKKMPEFNVEGSVQWRRACRIFQNLKPVLWKNAKEFMA